MIGLKIQVLGGGHRRMAPKCHKSSPQIFSHIFMGGVLGLQDDHPGILFLKMEMARVTNVIIKIQNWIFCGFFMDKIAKNTPNWQNVDEIATFWMNMTIHSNERMQQIHPHVTSSLQRLLSFRFSWKIWKKTLSKLIKISLWWLVQELVQGLLIFLRKSFLIFAGTEGRSWKPWQLATCNTNDSCKSH